MLCWAWTQDALQLSPNRLHFQQRLSLSTTFPCSRLEVLKIVEKDKTPVVLLLHYDSGSD